MVRYKGVEIKNILDVDIYKTKHDDDEMHFSFLEFGKFMRRLEWRKAFIWIPLVERREIGPGSRGYM